LSSENCKKVIAACIIKENRICYNNCKKVLGNLSGKNVIEGSRREIVVVLVEQMD
jgi:hypothetical protein